MPPKRYKVPARKSTGPGSPDATNATTSASTVASTNVVVIATSSNKKRKAQQQQQADEDAYILKYAQQIQQKEMAKKQPPRSSQPRPSISVTSSAHTSKQYFKSKISGRNSVMSEKQWRESQRKLKGEEEDDDEEEEEDMEE